MDQQISPVFKKSIGMLFLVLLALFPISNTIALRNLLLVFLASGLLLTMLLDHKQFAFPLHVSLKKMPWPILCWVGLLVLFPLWAPEPATAWQNLRGQWLEALLAGFVGYATFHLSGRKGPGLLALGFASSIPLLLHLVLCIAATQGWLNAPFYNDPNIATLWTSLRDPEAFQNNPHWTLQALMKGFRGIEPMHGNLGYPACQAICLFCTSFVQTVRTRNLKKQVASALGIALCFLSILIAQSRGAILYAFLLMAVSYVVSHVGFVPSIATQEGIKKGALGSRGMALALLAAVLLLGVTFQYVKQDPRWLTMVDSVEAAYAIEDPTKVLCEGMDSAVQEGIRSRLANHDPQYVEAVINALNSDGGRILIQRAGFRLMLEHPLGLDGSRQSFRKLMQEQCGHEPAMAFAHAHNSWIDLALALGWLGLLAFAGLMVFFVYRGVRGMQSGADRQWAMALVLIGTFWILRGFADAVYREHYLQMQFLLLMYLFGRLQFAAITPQEGD